MSELLQLLFTVDIAIAMHFCQATIAVCTILLMLVQLTATCIRKHIRFVSCSLAVAVSSGNFELLL